MYTAFREIDYGACLLVELLQMASAAMAQLQMVYAWTGEQASVAQPRGWLAMIYRVPPQKQQSRLHI